LPHNNAKSLDGGFQKFIVATSPTPLECIVSSICGSVIEEQPQQQQPQPPTTNNQQPTTNNQQHQ